MQLQTVKVGSLEWKVARQLRYELFFEKHSLPQSVLDDGKEESAHHLVAIIGDHVVGYGRLSTTTSSATISSATPPSRLQISQMVVAPEFQGQGVGTAILRALIDLASSKGASLIELNARLPAVQFYSSEGFRTIGASFISDTTKVEHIAMQAEL